MDKDTSFHPHASRTSLHHSLSTRPPTLFTCITIISIITAGTASMLYLFSHNPHTHTIALCPFHACTGLWCPLCGGLRWTYDIMQGNASATIYDNAALPLLLFTAAGYGYCHHIRSAQQKLWLQGLIVTLILWTIIRNLPWYPYPLT